MFLFVHVKLQGVKIAFPLSWQKPFPNLPICSIQLQHKGPSHFTSSLHPEETIWQGLSKFCMTGAYSLQIWHPVVTLFSAFNFFFFN